MYGSPIRPERRIIAALILALAAVAASAQPRSAPINIEADQGEVSQRTGESVYTGNVVLTQAATTLRGDKLTIHRDDNSRIRAVLVGDPARLKRTPEQGETVTGHARRMTYRSSENMVELVGDAFIERGGNTLRSQTIRHNLTTARTQAERGDGERVRITIQPETVDDGGEQDGDAGEGQTPGAEANPAEAPGPAGETAPGNANGDERSGPPPETPGNDG